MQKENVNIFLKVIKKKICLLLVFIASIQYCKADTILIQNIINIEFIPQNYALDVKNIKMMKSIATRQWSVQNGKLINCDYEKNGIEALQKVNHFL